MKRRGSSLVFVLGLLTAAVLVVFAVAEVSLFHLQFSTAIDSREHARNLAQGVIYRAISQMVDNPNLGAPPTAASEVSYTGDASYPVGARGYLTFWAASATANRMHRSTNNNNVSSLPGDGRTVPPYTVHLVGLGECGGIRVQIECLYNKPPFPKGLSCSGKAALSAVTMVGLAPNATYSGDWASVPADQQIPANVFADSNANSALTLDAACNVSGGVGACGGIDIASGATVSGEVRDHASAQEVPSFNPGDMLTRLQGVLGLLPFDPAQTTLNDFALVNGDLTLTHDLTLDGGVLGVNGTLNMSGGRLLGRGAVIVASNANLSGSSFEANRQCALVAGGTVTLAGSDSHSFFFQGIVYSGTSIVASGVTVVGSVVCNGSPGDVQLNNVRIIQSPSQVQGRRGLPYDQLMGSDSPYELDGGDSARISLFSVPDPNHFGQFLLYGQAQYSESPIGANGALQTTFSGVNVTWTTGSSAWVLRPGNTNMDTVLHLPFTQAYDGTPAALNANMKTLMENDNTNPPAHVDYRGPYQSYYDFTAGNLTAYESKLMGSGSNDTSYFDFNLNRLITPGADSRILLMQEIP